MKVVSAIFSQMSGSFDGIVAMNTSAGTMIRQKIIPRNPQTPAQVAVREALAIVTQTFLSTTVNASQRQAWDDYAVATNTTNALGGVSKLTGPQAFVKVNAIRQQLGLAITLDPPATGLVTPVLTLVTADVEKFHFTYTAPADATNDAYKLNGALRIWLAYAQPWENRRYTAWQSVTTITGAGVRPAALTEISTETLPNITVGGKLFYRIGGSTPGKKPTTILEGFKEVADV